MITASVPLEELKRLSVVDRHSVLDATPECVFDEITSLIAGICRTPVAFISILDDSRQWFKSRFGRELEETALSVTFCAYTICQSEVFVVPDATQDQRFRENPLVTGDPHIAFYAGAPILTEEGIALGTLGIVDYVPRQLSVAQKNALQVLARQVAAQLELRKRRMDSTEEAQLRMASRGEALIRALGEIIYDHEMATDVIEWGGNVEGILGWGLREIGANSQGWLDLVHREDLPEVFRQFQKGGSNGFFSCEYRIRHKEGHYVWIYDRGVVYRDSDGKVTRLIGILWDISERKKAEEKLRKSEERALAEMSEQMRLQEQLRQSQKMEAIGQLASGVAHDFNNLLTVIQGNAGLLLMDVVEPASKGFIQEIVQAAERASSLTRQLVLFSRKQVMQPINLDVNGVVSNMTRMLQRILGEDITLESNYAPSLPLIHGDVGMLEQVLLNLAVNSRDAMPSGGKLQISTSLGTISEGSPYPDAQLGPSVRLTVRDSGCGIAADVLPHIFEPFFTTKDVGKGTGLGLATIYGIVRQHRGTLSVESESGKGAIFHIDLPALDEPHTEPIAEEESLQMPLGSETILLVEDEQSVRLMSTHLLQLCGYTVLTASTGVAALEVWARRKESIDLLLSDMIMPDGMTGGQLAEQLRTEKPDLKVIFTSGYGADVVGKGFSLVEGTNFLQKPYRARQLAQAVRERLDRK